MIFLVDNGSVRADAFHNLCKLSSQLSSEIQETVYPRPLLHANKIPEEELGGKDVRLLEEGLVKAYESGERAFDILPLFFGPSGALADYLPRRLGLLKSKGLDFDVRILKPLFVSSEDGGPLLTDIIQERIEAVQIEHGLSDYEVILVDHGSPKKEVVEVRNTIAELLAHRFVDSRIRVSPASMERRPGKEYAFNEPLLETALPHSESRNVILAHLFLSPGRHAGPGGDIEDICNEATNRKPNLKVYRTELIGNHPLLVKLLAQRWQERVSVPWLSL